MSLMVDLNHIKFMISIILPIDDGHKTQKPRLLFLRYKYKK